MSIEERIKELDKDQTWESDQALAAELLAALREIVALKLELAAVSKRLIALVRGRDL